MTHVDTSSKSEQRKFGIVMAVAITVVGLVRWLFHGLDMEALPSYFFSVAAVFLVLGLVAPKLLQPVFWGWMKFALAVNWVMTRVFLTIAFLLLLTPFRLLIRLFSDDPLKRAWAAEGESYWEAPEDQPKNVDRYRDQY